jgi:hypothetical protein
VNVNSYKFSKPRIYIKNDFQTEDKPLIDILREICCIMGTKHKPSSYNTMIDGLLSKSKKNSKKSRKIVSLNNSSSSKQDMKSLTINLNGTTLNALVDTGSSHCLITSECFSKLKNVPFESIFMLMKVAGSTLTDNIVG